MIKTAFLTGNPQRMGRDIEKENVFPSPKKGTNFESIPILHSGCLTGKRPMGEGEFNSNQTGIEGSSDGEQFHPLCRFGGEAWKKTEERVNPRR